MGFQRFGNPSSIKESEIKTWEKQKVLNLWEVQTLWRRL